MSWLAIRRQASAVRARSESSARRGQSQLGEHDELTELEAGDDGATTELGEVVLVATADSLDETMHP